MELACTNRRVLALLVSSRPNLHNGINSDREVTGETSPRSLVIYHEKIGIYTRDASVDLGSRHSPLVLGSRPRGGFHY